LAIHLYNTLTNRLEPFTPLTPATVRMYHCGPTVYSSPHIGNFRAFLLADLLRRFFEDQGTDVLQVMNVTDVGHMTADDEDAGEDPEAKEQGIEPTGGDGHNRGAGTVAADHEADAEHQAADIPCASSLRIGKHCYAKCNHHR